MFVDLSSLRTRPSYFTLFLMGKLALIYARSSGTHSSTRCDETWRYSRETVMASHPSCTSVLRFCLYLYDYQRHAPVSMTSKWRKVTQQRKSDQHISNTLWRSCANRSSRNTSLFASSPSSSLFVHIFQLSGRALQSLCETIDSSHVCLCVVGWCPLYESRSEYKERFATQRYLLIIGKKQNIQVLSHTFTYFSK